MSLPEEPDDDLYADSIALAADRIVHAEGLLIGAGAGMGVDSGLPDFRGNDGFWNAYPAFRSRKLSFVEMANPLWFETDPEQAWGFYGHRLNLYRQTVPHDGFGILRTLTERTPKEGFVFTSNVDGQFQRAGFDEARIVECHGSIGHLQCSAPCTREIWPADDLRLEIDEDDCRALGELPRCPRCERIARPNILMFGDYTWVADRTAAQEVAFLTWLDGVHPKRLVAIECGAGLAVPTVRLECERRTRNLIRINPREPDVPRGGIGLPAGASVALRKIAECVG